MLFRLVLVSAALAASCTASPAQVPKVYVALHTDSPRSLSIDADYRGTYGGLELYVVDADRRSLKYFSSLPEATVLPSDFNPQDSSSILAVVEYEQHDSDGVMAGSHWLRRVSSSVRSNSLVDYFLPIRPRTQGDIERALIRFPADQRQAVLETLPSNTVFLPIPSKEVTPAESLTDAAVDALSAAGVSPSSFVEADPVTPNAFIASIVKSVNEDSILKTARFLTGEDTRSGITTRNTYSKDIYIAADFIKAEFESQGFNSSFFSYDAKLAPNVVNILPGATNPEKIVILGAHYDSRGPTVNSPTNPAPGGNDDGSGTSMLIEAARVFGQARLPNGQSAFKYSIHVVAFSGEEQGLLGSRAYSDYLKKNKANVVAMIQGDMIGYRKPGEAAQCAFPTRYHTADLTASLKAITKAYSPELTVGDSSACCSDHQSFYENGFASTQFFERNGPIADDQYHKAGDVTARTGYNPAQITSIARAMIASIATLAVPN